MGVVPRVESRRRVGGGELSGHCLAQHDSPSLLQLGDDGGIVVGHEVGVQWRAGSGLHACRIEDILQANGHTMQCPKRLPPGDGLLSPGGSTQHLLAVHGDPRLQVLPWHQCVPAATVPAPLVRAGRTQSPQPIHADSTHKARPWVTSIHVGEKQIARVRVRWGDSGIRCGEGA